MCMISSRTIKGWSREHEMVEIIIISASISYSGEVKFGYSIVFQSPMFGEHSTRRDSARWSVRYREKEEVRWMREGGRERRWFHFFFHHRRPPPPLPAHLLISLLPLPPLPSISASTLSLVQKSKARWHCGSLDDQMLDNFRWWNTHQTWHV